MPDVPDRTERMAAAIREDEIEAALKAGKGGGVTLLLHLMSDIDILKVKMIHAESQRNEIDKKVNEALQDLSALPVLARDLSNLAKDFDGVNEAIQKNTEFRLKFTGGSIVLNFIWMSLGAVLLWALQMIWEKRS